MLINKEIILTNWDWPDRNGPKCVEAVIKEFLEDDKYEIRLKEPLKLFNRTPIQDLIIQSRHAGHPINKIVPSSFLRILMINKFFSRTLAPYVAANIYSLQGAHISIASVYLKSIYLKCT